MSQPDIERLRALEKEWRKESDDFERDGDEDSASAYYNCAERLSDLIAELGQEVGAVPNGKLVGWWNGITPGFDGMGVPSVRWGADAENSRHDIPLYDGYNPIHYVTPPSSPAHTSEARDGARLNWLVSNEFDLVTRREDIGEDEYAIWWFVVDSRKSTARHLHTVSGHPLGSPREAIDAAMRQEGGTP